MFSCSKIEQKQLNTWVSFQSAEQPLLGQFSVSGNMNKHLKGGWVLLSQATGKDEQGYPLTQYVVGWLADEEPLAEHLYA